MVCNHPAVAEVRVDPVTGTAKLEPTISPADARAEDGPCGPEGLLFDTRSVPATVLVALLSSDGGRLLVGLTALIGAATLFG